MAKKKFKRNIKWIIERLKKPIRPRASIMPTKIKPSGKIYKRRPRIKKDD